jgi:hypothetical protein
VLHDPSHEQVRRRGDCANSGSEGAKWCCGFAMSLLMLNEFLGFGFRVSSSVDFSVRLRVYLNPNFFTPHLEIGANFAHVLQRRTDSCRILSR